MAQKNKISFLSAQYLLDKINSFPVSQRIHVAYSGGLDSSVLLHLFYSTKSNVNHQVKVIHVDHGLNKKSKQWAEFCQKKCDQYGFELSILTVNETCPDGESIEAWARSKRYELLAGCVSSEDILVTAHHLDDQIETFFIQALRGAGPRGLASMPEIKKFEEGYLIRPFLEVSREVLAKYAEKNQLSWLDDDSNQEERFDRNYLRHRILPLIESRWSAYRTTISRLLNHQQHVKSLLKEIATQDFAQIRYGTSMNVSVSKLVEFSDQRKINIIFYWLDLLKLNAPNTKHMKQILNELLTTEAGASGCVNWSGSEIRRYRDVLYALKPAIVRFNSDTVISWNIKDTISIMEETLSANLNTGVGVSKQQLDNRRLEIRFRQGGEKIVPASGNCTKSVKQLFQENGVLPWYRDKIPLIYLNDNLVVIPGLCIDKKFVAKPDELAWDIQWQGYAKVVQ